MDKDNSINNKADDSNSEEFRTSSLNIIVLTIIFSAISVATILGVNAIWKLSLPLTLWCVLAASIAVVFYLARLLIKPKAE